MAPMCTPEKAKESHPANNLEELYFIPRGAPDEESITDCSELDDSDDDEEVKQKMDGLVTNFPELEKHFDLHGQVGEGTFSTVYVAALKNGDRNQRFAIKHIVPTCHPERIKFELNCLKQIGGSDNVVGINLCLRNLNNVIFVMPYQQHDYFAEYVGGMDAAETKLYMYNLLTAIARVHHFDVIHRDIKPSNFLYDRQNKKFLLVDFGLAQKQPLSKTEKCITAGKRKREDLSSPSPSNGVTQASKRHVLQTREINITVATSTEPVVKSFNRAIPTQKENHPNNLHVSKGQNTPKITYIQFDNSPELKLAAAKQQHHHQQQQRREACGCYGKSKVCSMCMVNPPLQASRAGTPGFRPPEVLFKYPHQTTAVDIWASGIILLSILSNCSNFFSCPNDIAALLELITIFGYENINKVANKFGRYFVCSEKKSPLDLRKICCTLRQRGTLNDLLTGDKCSKCDQFKRACLCRNIPMDKSIKDEFPKTVYHLLHRLLDLNPTTRITANAALLHPFFKSTD